AQLLPALARGQRLRLRYKRLEDLEVDLAGLGPQDVAPRLRDDDVGAEVLAEPRDVVLQGSGGVRGHALAPELLDQAVPANDLVRVEHEEREHGTALGTANVDRATVAHHLEGTEHPKLHQTLTVAP